ncbi:DNA replication helicase [Folsomia candida]|uniref:DNA replication helicase n=1 Tax=Folsomia candida TaxID=158441 RepID=A0A226CXA9_FOLCA|nr:DNA replication helicase [Folsomia candida]
MFVTIKFVPAIYCYSLLAYSSLLAKTAPPSSPVERRDNNSDDEIGGGGGVDLDMQISSTGGHDLEEDDETTLISPKKRQSLFSFSNVRTTFLAGKLTTGADEISLGGKIKRLSGK